MAVIARDTVVNSVLVFKVLRYWETQLGLIHFECNIQVAFLVMKRNLGNHVAAINPSVVIPVADTGRLLLAFSNSNSNITLLFGSSVKGAL